jgi:hypothetical protein
MHCVRLDHFLKIETGSSPLVRCCHMANPPRFKTIKEVENSQWISNVKQQLNEGIWPDECIRCKQAEDAGFESVRNISNKAHEQLSKVKDDYMIVDVIVDTICNAACPICSEDLSSTIAKLKQIPINPFDGLSVLEYIDKERIVQLDILGGEPGASKKSKRLLRNLETYTNLQSIHLSTNGSMIIPEIEALLEKGVKVDLVISMDGSKDVFEYCRFPIKWSKFVSTLEAYKKLQEKYQNLSLLLWSAIHALCVADIDNMINFSKEIDIHFNGAPLQYPTALDISKKNFLTLEAKDICKNSQHEFARRLYSLIALDESSNDNEVLNFLAENDSVRKTNYKLLYV